MGTETREQWAKRIHKTISDEKKKWYEGRFTSLIVCILTFPFSALILTAILVEVFDELEGEVALGIATVIVYGIYRSVFLVRRAWKFQETMYTIQEILICTNMAEGDFPNISPSEEESFDDENSEPVDLI